MLAVFETGGKQYKVTVGDEVNVEMLPGDPGATVVFDKLVMVSRDEEILVGKPWIDGATVHAEILEQDKEKKVLILKHKQRKRYNKHYGHRQPFTRVKITEIKVA